MKYYKKISKELRKEFRKNTRNVFKSGVKGFFKFPLLYKKRKELFALGEVKNNLDLPNNHDYWLVDNTEYLIPNDITSGLDYVSCIYGDPGYRKLRKFDYETASKWQKFWQALRWIIRNSAYNLKIRNGFKLKGNIPDELHIIWCDMDYDDYKDYLNWRDQTDVGFIVIEFPIEKLDGSTIRGFRYSYTLPLHRWNPARLFGFKWENVMRGYGAIRFIWKWRYFKFIKTSKEKLK